MTLLAGVGGNGRLVLLLLLLLVVVVGMAGSCRSTGGGLLMDRGGEIREEEGREMDDAVDGTCCRLALCALFSRIHQYLHKP